ncbi:MAG TPA: glycosyltransferase [bacterium]|nr:glycosyltransferase [bacterium]
MAGNHGIKRAVVLTGSGIIVPLIAEECCIGMRQNDVLPIKLEPRITPEGGFDEIKDDLYSAIREMNPDFVFSMDAGIVREIPDLFASLDIPIVSWFVDDPTYHITPDVMFEKFVAFTWDRAFIDHLSNTGCKIVEYLPLATNPARFRRVPADRPECEPFRCDISFVGSSLKTGSILEKIKTGLQKELRDIYVECIEKHAVPPHTPVPELLEQAEKNKGVTIQSNDRLKLAKTLAVESMMLYRARAINSISEFSPHVYGDEGWGSLLDPGAEYRGPIDYMENLNLLYSASEINLNLSKSQLVTSVNQRVFDAPACGGFVLTDYREDAELLFDPGTELAVFRTGGELREMAGRFLRDEKQRKERARNTRRRVLSEHTYKHRMKTLIETISEKAR